MYRVSPILRTMAAHVCTGFSLSWRTNKSIWLDNINYDLEFLHTRTVENQYTVAIVPSDTQVFRNPVTFDKNLWSQNFYVN